ncbi:hypothetical protein ACB098_11G168400 [Castanea mollissima]
MTFFISLAHDFEEIVQGLHHLIENLDFTLQSYTSLDCKIFTLTCLSKLPDRVIQIQIPSLKPSSEQESFLLRISFSFCNFIIFSSSVSTSQLETISLCCSTNFVLLISTAL